MFLVPLCFDSCLFVQEYYYGLPHYTLPACVLTATTNYDSVFWICPNKAHIELYAHINLHLTHMWCLRFAFFSSFFPFLSFALRLMYLINILHRLPLLHLLLQAISVCTATHTHVFQICKDMNCVRKSNRVR